MHINNLQLITEKTQMIANFVYVLQKIFARSGAAREEPSAVAAEEEGQCRHVAARKPARLLQVLSARVRRQKEQPESGNRYRSSISSNRQCRQQNGHSFAQQPGTVFDEQEFRERPARRYISYWLSFLCCLLLNEFIYVCRFSNKKSTLSS